MDNVSRRDRGRLLALGERLVAALELLTEPAPVHTDVAPSPEPMLVRHLDVSHLGRWISLPGNPKALGRPGIHEPTVAAAAGRLVGYRPGEATTARTTRVLVLLQGSKPLELQVDVGALVVVAPREWN